MNAHSLSNELKQAQQDREQEARTSFEKQKIEWQNYLRAESQHFKSFIAETESRCRKLVRLALAMTTLSFILASVVMLAATWRTARTESQLHKLRAEISESQDRLANLRAAHYFPVGKPVNVSGRTFIEINNLE